MFLKLEKLSNFQLTRKPKKNFQVTKKILKIPGKLDPFQLWPMQILTWNEFSKQPLAKLQGQCLGRAGSLEAEEKHALLANELADHDVDFPEEELDEVDEIVKEAWLFFWYR